MQAYILLQKYSTVGLCIPDFLCEIIISRDIVVTWDTGNYSLHISHISLGRLLCYTAKKLVIVLTNCVVISVASYSVKTKCMTITSLGDDECVYGSM